VCVRVLVRVPVRVHVRVPVRVHVHVPVRVHVRVHVSVRVCVRVSVSVLHNFPYPQKATRFTAMEVLHLLSSFDLSLMRFQP